MNTQTQATPRIKLLEREWIAAVQEAIEARHKNMSEVIDSFLMGRFDAEMGHPCDPTRYYAKLGDIESYIIAYNDTTAAWAAAVQEVNNSLPKPVNYEAELEELVEGAMDIDFWRQGGA